MRRDKVVCQLMAEHDEPVNNRLGSSRWNREARLMQLAKEMEITKQRASIVERYGLCTRAVEDVQARFLELEYLRTNEKQM